MVEGDHHYEISPITQPTQIAKFMGPTGAHPGPVGARWAPCWPHEPCYQDTVAAEENASIVRVGVEG